MTYAISGDGFLRHMVRSIVGTLVEVGRGRQPSSWVGEVLAARDRRFCALREKRCGSYDIKGSDICRLAPPSSDDETTMRPL